MNVIVFSRRIWRSGSLNGCRLFKKRQADAVVRDKNIIISREPGTVVDFALEIVMALAGEKEAENLRKNILYDKKKHTI